MQGFVRFICSSAGVLAALSLLAVSALMNWQFGYGWGRTHFEGQIYGAAAVSGDVLKALLPLFIAWAVMERHLIRGLCGVALLLICVSYSLTSSLGFASLNRTAKIGQQDIQAMLNADRKASIPELRKELKNVNKKLKYRLSGKDRLRLRKRRTKLEGDISSAQAALGAAIASGTTYTVADPQADFLAGVTGAAKPLVEIWLIFMVAALVELGSTLGLFVSFGHLKMSLKRAPALVEPPAERIIVKRSSVAPAATVRRLPSKKERLIRAWVDDWTMPTTEGALRPADAHNAFIHQTGNAVTPDAFYKVCNAIFRERGWEKTPHTVEGRRYPLLLARPAQRAA